MPHGGARGTLKPSFVVSKITAVEAGGSQLNKFTHLAAKQELALSSGAGFHLPEDEFLTIIEALQIAGRVQSGNAIADAIASWGGSPWYSEAYIKHIRDCLVTSRAGN